MNSCTGNSLQLPRREVGFVPTGGQSPVSVAAGTAALFELSPPRPSTPGGPQDDLVYFRNGDVLPGTVHRAAADRIELTSTFSERSMVRSSVVRAVELAAEPVAPLSGFDDRWNVDDETLVTVEANEMRFMGQGVSSRDGLITGCDHIAFDLERVAGSGSVFVHVRLTGATESSDAVVPFYFMDNKLFVMGSKRNAFIPSSDDGVARIVIETHDPFRVEVNGDTVYSIPGRVNGGPWAGLTFEVSDGPLFGAPLARKTI